MVSANEADFNLRETQPPPRNILCRPMWGHRPTADYGEYVPTGRARTRVRVSGRRQPSGAATGVSGLIGDYHEPPESGDPELPDTKGAADGPENTLPPAGSREERLGCSANRHLNYLAESIHLNTGGCPETDVPSSRGEKHGQRRSHHSSRRSGEPITGRRVAVCRDFGAN